MLTDPLYKKATCIAIVLAFFNQWAGVTACLIYSYQIFVIMNDAGLNLSAANGSFMLGLSALMGASVAPFAHTTLKARSIVIGGFLLMAFFVSASGVCFMLSYFVTMLVFLLLHVFVFNITIGSYFWNYVGQTAEASANGIASMTIFANSLFFGLTTQTFFEVLNPAGTFIGFGVCCLIAAFFCSWQLKEIKGLSVEDAKKVYRIKKYEEVAFHEADLDEISQVRMTEKNINATLISTKNPSMLSKK